MAESCATRKVGSAVERVFRRALLWLLTGPRWLGKGIVVAILAFMIFLFVGGIIIAFGGVATIAIGPFGAHLARSIF